jgi:hypothetical protein
VGLVSPFNPIYKGTTMKLRSLVLAAVAAIGLAGAAFAQSYVSGAIVVTSLANHFSMGINTTGPQSAIVLLSGGTFTCAASAATVVDSYVNAGSLVFMTLKTVGGTVAAPFVATITPATGFTVTCGGSDTSTYNYLIFG